VRDTFRARPCVAGPPHPTGQGHVPWAAHHRLLSDDRAPHRPPLSDPISNSQFTSVQFSAATPPYLSLRPVTSHHAPLHSPARLLCLCSQRPRHGRRDSIHRLHAASRAHRRLAASRLRGVRPIHISQEAAPPRHQVISAHGPSLTLTSFLARSLRRWPLTMCSTCCLLYTTVRSASRPQWPPCSWAGRDRQPNSRGFLLVE
jgi:hypothetical protein